MPRSPRDNQDIRDARREELLSAAIRVFSERGLGPSKISDIAQAAGLSHGLLYRYFDSKDAIFTAIVERQLSRIDEDFAASEVPAFERLARLVEQCGARSVRPDDAWRVISQAMMTGVASDVVRQQISAHLGQVHARLTAWIAEAQRDGDVDAAATPAELAAALMCLVRGMTIRMPGMDLPFAMPGAETILRLLRHPTPTPGAAVAPADEASPAPSRRSPRSHAPRPRRT